MWWLDFRTRDVGGPVAAWPQLYEDGRLAAHGLAALPVPAAGVTFVVHGFNNDRGEGVGGLRGFVDAAVARVPELADKLFVGVLWPGDAIVGFLSYPTEEADADRTAAGFARVLATTAFPQPPHFAAHSLGCRVVMRTLDLLAESDPDRAWCDRVVLMAGAVDGDVLARDDRYLDATENASRVVNVASTKDRVLRFAFPIGDFAAGILSGGAGSTRSALGRHGPARRPAPPRHVRRVQLGSTEDVDHGDYLRGANAKQRRIAELAGRALAGEEVLRY